MEPTTTRPGEAILQCPRCRSALHVRSDIDRIEEACPICRGRLDLFVFPRLFRAPAPVETAAPSVSGEREATCAFYPELKAEKICDRCGAFLSEKASVRWSDSDFCLPCLHHLREEEKATDFVARADFPENRALALVTWLAPFSLFTAPLAFYLLIRHRKPSPGFVPRGRGRWWTALILTLALLAGWGTLLVIWISLIVSDFS